MSPIVNSSTIVLISILCYWASLFGDFVFDDTEAIVNNNDVMTDTSISQVLANDFWGTNMSDTSSHKSYRPITIITFRLIRKLSGLLFATPKSPFLFHVCNLTTYIALNLLLWSVLDRIYKLLDANDSNQSTPFLVTVLFACHPVHSEVVSQTNCYSLLQLYFAQ